MAKIFLSASIRKIKETKYEGNKKTALKLPPKLPLIPSSTLQLLDELNEAADKVVDLAMASIKIYFDQLLDPDFFVLFESEFTIILFAPPPPVPPPLATLCYYLLSAENFNEMVRIYEPVLAQELDGRDVMSMYLAALGQSEKKKGSGISKDGEEEKREGGEGEGERREENGDEMGGENKTSEKERELEEERERHRIKNRIYRAAARLALRGIFEMMMEMEVAFRSFENLSQWNLSSREMRKLSEIQQLISAQTTAK